MLAAPSLIQASAACLNSDTYSQSGMKILPTRIGPSRISFVGTDATPDRTDCGLSHASCSAARRSVPHRGNLAAHYLLFSGVGKMKSCRGLLLCALLGLLGVSQASAQVSYQG